MLTQQGLLAIAEPSRYMTRLCYHWTKKITVEYDGHRGLAHFPWGTCRMEALPDAIRFACEAADEASLGQVRHVIDAHVALFARRAPLAVAWEPAGKP